MSAFTRNNLLPLETFRDQIVKLDPWFFWGFDSSLIAQGGSQCNVPLYKFAWQGTMAAGRADYEDAISTAEKRFFRAAHFHPAPKYATDKLRYPHYGNPRLELAGGIAGDGHWMPFEVKDTYVTKCGIHTLTLIKADATITRSDTTADGLKDTFTLSATLPAGVTDPTEIVALFSSGDRFGDTSVSVDTYYRWNVRPINVSISGNTVTITGPGWLVAKPAQYENADEALDPTDDSVFVTTLDVYRYYIDPTGTTTDDSSAVVFWETLPVGGFPGWWGGLICDPTNPSLDPAAVAMNTARINVRKSEIGVVYGGEAQYNATSGLWSQVYTHRPPDSILVRYQAGFPLENGKMAQEMVEGLSRLAAAEAIELHCACETSKKSFAHWQKDLSRTSGNETFGAITPEDLQNPFGPRRGHVDCWKQVKQYRILRGFSPIAG